MAEKLILNIGKSILTIGCYVLYIMTPFCLSIYFYVVYNHTITKADKKLRVSFKCQKTQVTKNICHTCHNRKLKILK